MIDETKRCLHRVGLDLDPLMPVEEISQHEAQLVEIARALGNAPCILVMDEPTSALSRAEVNHLFEIIRRLRKNGLAIVYISHHMPEILEIADRVTILRDGRKVATKPIHELDAAQMVELMVGRSISELYATRKNPPCGEKLRVENFSRYGFFHQVSFSMRAGEVVGIGGLAGAGRSELARSLCGIDPVDAGTIRLDGQRVEWSNYRDAIRAGFAYLTEDRKAQGLALRMSVGENALAAVLPRFARGGFTSGSETVGLLGKLIDRLQVYPPDTHRPVGSLSGGNQQKVLLAKWLATEPQVLILDEPTRGVDVGAKVVIHKAIAEAADRGAAVLLISSDLPELIGLADRVLIMRKGRLIGQLDRGDATEATVLLAANGEGSMKPL
jgi:ribose transport system ATP-binding protein